MTGEDQATILLETINPYDMPPEELQELADELQQVLPDLRVEVAFEEQHGAGVSMHEVVHVWLPSAEWLKDGGYTLLVTVIFRWFKKRFKKHGNAKRPKSVILHDSETGKELGTLVLKPDADSPESEPADTTVPRKKPVGRHRKE